MAPIGYFCSMRMLCSLLLAGLCLSCLCGSCQKFLAPEKVIRYNSFQLSNDCASCLWIQDDTSVYLLDMLTMEPRKQVPVYYERGTGSELWLAEGSRYLYVLPETPRLYHAYDLQQIDKATMRITPDKNIWLDYPLLENTEIREVYLHQWGRRENDRRSVMAMEDTSGNYYTFDLETAIVTRDTAAKDLVYPRYNPVPLFSFVSAESRSHALAVYLAIKNQVKDTTLWFEHARFAYLDSSYCIIAEQDRKKVSVFNAQGKLLTAVSIPEADPFRDRTSGDMNLVAHYVHDTLMVLTYHKEQEEQLSRVHYHYKAFVFDRTGGLIGASRFVWQ